MVIPTGKIRRKQVLTIGFETGSRSLTNQGRFKQYNRISTAPFFQNQKYPLFELAV